MVSILLLGSTFILMANCILLVNWLIHLFMENVYALDGSRTLLLANLMKLMQQKL